MKRPRIVIAGANSGAGKTTVTLGLMAALKRRGLRVQGFKVGPDYIDPSYHAAVTGRVSRNLDTWMMAPEVMKEVFHRGSAEADVSVIEGVMGMYDGKDPLSNHGSTAEVAGLLDAPVILVVNVSSMARSAAAVVLGFQQMDAKVRLAGVIVNHVGSRGHYQLVKAAIEQVCKVPVVGYLQYQPELQIPERHLGLIPALERGELQPLFDALAATAEQSFQVGRILQLAAEPARWNPPEASLFVGEPQPSTVKLAVAMDSAFHFYYPENLELLAWYGADLRYFRPLEGEIVPPDADGLYIGGGFPEEFASPLSKQTAVLASVRNVVRLGMPVFAECGGFMFLKEALVDTAGVRYPMAGFIPGEVTMQPKLAALGYREVTALADTLLLKQGESARGHEFHYSIAGSSAKDGEWPYAYTVKGMRGVKQDGYAKGNLLAGYVHLHFASNPGMVRRWLAACRIYRDARGECVP